MKTIDNLGYQKINNILPIDFCRKTAKSFAEEIIYQTPIKYDIQRGWCWQYYKPAPMQIMLEQVKSKIEIAVGEKLLPTYSYITAYTNNSYMTIHKDRPACEVSVSINLASTFDWGLYITDLQGKETKVITKVGDGVIYLGTQVEHWRDLLITDKPEFYIQTFLHYVRANGEYAQYENDTSVHPNRDA
tara:strand:- start:34 stop:597 length:564 start_codon:yes stop_codon:yes gene_type:complete